MPFMPFSSGAGGKIQTFDLSIMSQLFYHQGSTYSLNTPIFLCHLHPVSKYYVLTVLPPGNNLFYQLSFSLGSFSLVPLAVFNPFIFVL
jgi:hypothetical protein